MERSNKNMKWGKCLKCGLRIYKHRDHICIDLTKTNQELKQEGYTEHNTEDLKKEGIF